MLARSDCVIFYWLVLKISPLQLIDLTDVNSVQDVWGGLDFGRIPIAETTLWSSSTMIAANDRNFPCLNLTTGPNLPDVDLEVSHDAHGRL